MMIRVKSSVLVPLTLGILLIACSEQAQEPVAPPLPEKQSNVTTPPQAAAVPTGQDQTQAEAETASVEKGMFFGPELADFALHNESDEDGDGDGVNETHVRRYINKGGDTAFSMTTNDRLWAWSLDTKAGDDSEIRKNFVIRDSNCDGVFDERYSLDAEFRVPVCLQKAAAPH